MKQTVFLNHATGVAGEAVPFAESNTNALTLRDYQQESIAQLARKHQSGKRRVILCLPTGAGKTVTFAEIARRTLAEDPQARVLILTDRTELLTQAVATLGRAGMQAGILNADTKRMPTQRVIVAMVETYYRRVKKGWRVPDLKRVIIDEAHKGNFRKVMALHPDMPLIGATATPIASSKHQPLHQYFDSIVVGTEIHLLIEEGYLSRPRYFAVPLEITASKGNDGDYRTGELFADFDKPALYAGCVSNWQRHAKGRKTLVFCVNIAHTIQTAQAFALVHGNVRSITSDTPPEERQATLRWFSRTADAVLVNCGILTTGFDEPTVECILLNRATQSLPLFLQMCGRGSRITASKREFIILDMGNNLSAHGLWHTPHDWEYVFWHGRWKDKLDVAPIKQCPECESMVATATQTCPHCGHVFELTTKPEPEATEIRTEELEVDWSYLKHKAWSEMNVTELMQRALLGSVHTGQPYRTQWIIRCIMERENPRPLLEELARQKGYYPGWVDKCIREHAKAEATRLIREYKTPKLTTHC